MERAQVEGIAIPGIEMGAGVAIRDLESRRDLEACVDLQREVWGAEFREFTPANLLAICRKMGGVVAGAFEDDRLLAFVFGITGLYGGERSHWSHMLGVRPAIRDRGLGFLLKAYQREQLLSVGVRSVQWTFDPLESRNAHLNLSKLGIIVREYVPDMYGPSDSPLHGGIGTDRLVALWRLEDERVARRMRGHRPACAGDLVGIPEAVIPDGMENGFPVPVVRPVPAGARAALVSIPADIQALKRADPELALRWRRATRRAFAALIDRAFEVRELVRGDLVSRYLLQVRSGR